MRRSFRDAIVGFSLIGGVVIFAGLTFWLKGLKVSSSTWSITANFNDATGLSEGTPVTFRGIKIGNVRKITFTPTHVIAKIRINQKKLKLFKPIYAKVETSSLLGGDAAISLSSEGVPIPNTKFLPTNKDCPKEIILCKDDAIEGYGLENISKLTGELNNLLNQADTQEIISKIVTSIEKFDSTQQNLDELIKLSKVELIRAQPIFKKLMKSVNHINSILVSIDDPEVLRDVKSSASSISSFTKKLDRITDRVDELVNDDELTNALKDAAIGIGNLFNDIYQ